MIKGEIWHGGDLAKARALFANAPEPWIDLSTGINPISYPLPPLPQSLWQRLPGADDEAALLAAARAAYHVPESAGIVAAPGTQILIDLLPRLEGHGPVAVLTPTYGEHTRTWLKVGRVAREIATLNEVGDAATVVIVNPNNPDGRVVSKQDLVAIAKQCDARCGALIVDEAFADFTPEPSIIPELPPATVVLRSFGKTYGLAGLRLGFAIGDPALTEALHAAMGPWAVAGPALRVGATALADSSWLAQAGAARAADAARLDALLAPHGRVVGGTALFRLLETGNAPALFAHLGRHGLYLRRFQNDVRWLRFGLPGQASEWARLEAALAGFATSGPGPA
ncbi:threonine-phosphate decarboxylase CobD [Bosea vaviloviae]|uniref:threonine-phosphate decarboxylase CobD n=1 Tax=Bosea vaviloviae TaxID=1526658 RepID=UPI000B3186B4|nr:threonine-phosphate decarboxylase CobD [Bosea vaviloviae]